jgi:HlyD family secretion protein
MPITSQLTTDKVTDFEVEIELDAFSPLLRPGMNVKTDITTNEKTDVLTIPIQASGKRKVNGETAQTVFIVKDGEAQLTEISTDVSSDQDIEIVSGVEEGDTVITGPYRVLSKLKDGQKVSFEIPEEDSISGARRQPVRLFRRLRRRG